MTTQPLVLTEDSIKILDTQKLTDKHAIIIEVDPGNLPRHRLEEHLTNIKDAFRGAFPEPIKIIVSTHKISVIEQE